MAKIAEAHTYQRTSLATKRLGNEDKKANHH